VFATRRLDSGSLGNRTHLFRVEAGRPLIGARDAGGLTMLGIGAPGTSVLELDAAALTRLADSAGPHALRIGALLDAAITDLYASLRLDARIPRHRTLEPGTTMETDAGVCVRPVSPVGWLEQTTGASCLVGSPTAVVSPGTLLPLIGQAWVRTTEASTLRLLTTAQQLTPGVGSGYAAAWQALERLQSRTMELVAERLRDAEDLTRERAGSKRRARIAAMSAAVARLAATLEPGGAKRTLMRLRPRAASENERDSLIPAFRLVAAAQGVELRELHRGHDQGSAKDSVLRLARAARVRVRRVALRDGWWNSDGDPLIGRLAESKRAVALLPARGGGWELMDPYARTQTRVNAEVAATLSPFAHTIYRPFAPDALRASDLLRFGLAGCRRDLTTVGLAGGAMALLGLVTPLVIAALYDSVIPGAERGPLVQLTLGLLVTAVALALFQVVRGTALLRIESRVGPRLQAAVWDRLLSLPLPFFRRYTSGDLAVRAMAIEEMRSIASGSVVTVVLSGVFSLANFGLLFYYNRSLAWIAALLIGLAVLVSLAVSYLQLRSQRVMLGLRSRTSGLVLQLLSGLAKLRTAGAEVHGFGLWARLFSEQREQQFRSRTLRNVQSTFNAVFPLLCTLTFFAVALPYIAPPASGPAANAASSAASAAALTTGDFLGFVAAFNGALGAMLASSAAVVGALAIVPLYEQVKPILETTPEVHAGKHDPGELMGSIELHHVTFRYHADAPAVLRDVSVRVRPGEFVALVGPSGSGKSTALRLLLGFEAAESGTVSYDEQDLNGLDIEAVRRQIGVVMQSGRVMAGDIFTNIVGSSSATIDDAWEAARMAGLDDDIREMPMGMHTVIADGGGTLSGGQRQRLMIARALLHRPRILFFDEATSALDNRTQDVVNRSLERLKATRVVVAHRLSTIRNADRIYVMRAGSVVETGSYDELLVRDGVFAELARRQLA
jgi:ATP-binding cassette subfamily C protein